MVEAFRVYQGKKDYAAGESGRLQFSFQPVQCFDADIFTAVNTGCHHQGFSGAAAADHGHFYRIGAGDRQQEGLFFSAAGF